MDVDGAGAESGAALPPPGRGAAQSSAGGAAADAAAAELADIAAKLAECASLTRAH